MGHHAAAPGCLHLIQFTAGFGGMDLKEHPQRLGRLLGFDQGLVRTGIRGVAKDGRLHQIRSAGPLSGEIPGHVDVARRIGNAGCRKIDDPLPDYGPHPHGDHGRGDVIGEKVAVAAGRRSAQQHLGTGEPCAQPDRDRIDVAGFGRENVVVEPLLERQIIGQPAEQGHGQMGVQVDEAGHHDAAAGIDRLAGRWERLTRLGLPHLPDPAVRDGHCAALVDVKGRIHGDDDTII